MNSPQSLTPAHAHLSSYLTVHSYTPYIRDAFAITTDPLSVNCALYLPPASKDPSADPTRQPKTIRICFAYLPLATKVSKAPSGSINHPTAPGQSLVLSCRLPSWEEILTKGGVQVQDELYVGGDGRVGVFCEILGGPRPGVKGETILERVHFGEIVYPGVGVGRNESHASVEGWDGMDSINGALQDHVFFPPSEGSIPKRSASPGASPRLRHKTSSLSIGGMRHINGGNQDATFFQPHFSEHQSEGGETYGSANSGSPDPPTPNELSTPDDSSSCHHSNNYSQPVIYNSNGPHQLGDGFSESPTFQTTFSTSSLNSAYQPPPNADASSSTIPSRPIKPLKKPSKASLRAQKSNSTLNSRPSSGNSTPSIGSASTSSAPAKITPVAISADTRLSLVVGGDLQTMAIGWSQEEWGNKRRLVQFWRRQSGTRIEASFKAIKPEEYVDGSIVISCIFREECNECFITSVDAIFLLEALLGTRFSIEEKNRIRRNLEASKPGTISKTKPETEAFFRLLMSFPKPKPRNIEKDVKVFRWQDIEAAIKKSISKYHYPESLTPGAVPTPVREPAKLTQTSADFVVAAPALSSKSSAKSVPLAQKRDAATSILPVHSRASSYQPPPPSPLLEARPPSPPPQLVVQAGYQLQQPAEQIDPYHGQHIQYVQSVEQPHRVRHQPAYTELSGEWGERLPPQQPVASSSSFPISHYHGPYQLQQQSAHLRHQLQPNRIYDNSSHHSHALDPASSSSYIINQHLHSVGSNTHEDSSADFHTMLDPNSSFGEYLQSMETLDTSGGDQGGGMPAGGLRKETSVDSLFSLI